MTLTKSKCFVIKSIDYSETTKIFTLFSERYGKIQVIAKGIKKDKSKLSSVVQNFNMIEAAFYFKEDNALSTLSDASVLACYGSLGSDMLKFALVCFVFEIIDISIAENMENHTIFNLLDNLLTKLNEAKSNLIDITMPVLYHIISELGYMPLTNNCVLCGRKEDLNYFLFSSGTVCSNCNVNNKDSIKINPAIPKIIDKYLNTDMNYIKLDKTQTHILFEIAAESIQYHHEKRLKSYQFLKSVLK
jgi:DNA repair protein RecO (recombination protein O)